MCLLPWFFGLLILFCNYNQLRQEYFISKEEEESGKEEGAFLFNQFFSSSSSLFSSFFFSLTYFIPILFKNAAIQGVTVSLLN